MFTDHMVIYLFIFWGDEVLESSLTIFLPFKNLFVETHHILGIKVLC